MTRLFLPCLSPLEYYFQLRNSRNACPLGISATLVQRSPNADHWRVVQYASRALSDAEQRYSQIELETLAADFACRKFHVFLYGKPFIVVSDHKPLEVIFNNPRHATSIRLQRMTVRMLYYEFRVEYRPGKTSISNYTSRHPLPLEQSSKRELGTTKDVTLFLRNLHVLLGSIYAKTVSALKAFFKASYASCCFSSHLKTSALTSALRTSVCGA